LVQLKGDDKLRYHLLRYRHYVAHQARLCNKAEVFAHKLRYLRDHPNTLGIDVDFAQKYLARSYRESMQEYLGKAGIVWHGCWLFWWLRAATTTALSDVTKAGHKAVLSAILRAASSTAMVAPWISDAPLPNPGNRMPPLKTPLQHWGF
jgi:hypothetical protein